VSHQFKPWEKPTRAKPTADSFTAPLESGELLAAKLLGIAAYQSPFERDRKDPDGIWYLHRRELDDGRVLYLEPMLGGTVSLCIATDQWNISDRYCYHDHDAGWRAVLGWNGKGDPEGWYRHSPSMRRRPDFTIESEYINASEGG
jgi:hypothetical protein